MRGLQCVLLAASALVLVAPVASNAVPVAAPQISIGIGIAPVCPYGYYDYAPYDCSPYGYYGPDWFSGGVFYGAGPWFHGPRGFHGHVDNRYDPRQGYRGPTPGRGSQQFNHFQGNEARDGRGNSVQENHSGGGEHALPGYRGGGGGGHAGGGGGHAGGGGGHPHE